MENKYISVKVRTNKAWNSRFLAFGQWEQRCCVARYRIYLLSNYVTFPTLFIMLSVFVYNFSQYGYTFRISKVIVYFESFCTFCAMAGKRYDGRITALKRNGCGSLLGRSWERSFHCSSLPYLFNATANNQCKKGLNSSLNKYRNRLHK